MGGHLLCLLGEVPERRDQSLTMGQGPPRQLIGPVINPFTRISYGLRSIQLRAPARREALVTDEDPTTATVPDGFNPLGRTSGFLELIGPIYQHPDGPVIGLRIDHRHLNSRSGAHGGLLATLADITLGYTTAFSVEPAALLSTAHLSIDYLAAVPDGAWLEVRAQVSRLGGRLAFARAEFNVEGSPVATANAVFGRASTPESAPARATPWTQRTDGL